MNTEILTEMRQRLTAIPQVQAASNWYGALPARDRLVVRGLAWLLGAALVYVLIFAPLLRENQRVQRDLDKKLDVYNLIAENAGKFGGASLEKSSGPILTLVTQAARSDRIQLDRYEQDGQGVRIWLDNIEFDMFIAWVESLQIRHGIRVSQITVDSSDLPGRVDVRATLENE
ncbi:MULTISPECIES: type II secretion system protein GspM [unclassified Oceanobacter]|jgi:general secretion pathway protein M|uniref:type II secretion system protein GspM n=1 Tax=unclassified Oceanobacter TaxID=2620260 RepID=UPI0026E367C1|nr:MULTISPECIES: type II secretion system protein GspM [unclassified Oceanobacter]MDO6681150.1 type II secretion system protein GspM [Oceanobacter sp. 5_MG-2023]MDP2504278.1 type II secretion system protein GspM [Oceanobacter sp. 3_MG-2023]MDP2546717.1 type II secretion system protein GspM [Oceanobacter sp. 4_MG-2023]MDP2608543.1 type II secretion system protein GspM [Oceanobacter sp. 1_MG-2023]MDP2611695.1 type II secretion system protein GspM [Oceanobacter sp. 2_MG-2023]